MDYLEENRGTLGGILRILKQNSLTTYCQLFHRLGNNVIVHPLHNIPTGDCLFCKHFQLL